MLHHPSSLSFLFSQSSVLNPQSSILSFLVFLSSSKSSCTTPNIIICHYIVYIWVICDHVDKNGLNLVDLPSYGVFLSHDKNYLIFFLQFKHEIALTQFCFCI